MIDGIKFNIDPQTALNSDVLKFFGNGENRKTAKYRGMIMNLYKDVCFVQGSIHKYKNNGKTNADDFKLSDFIETLNDLSAALNFNPDVTRFTNLEFGVNIKPNFDVRKFIDSVVYCKNGIYSIGETNNVKISFTEWEIKIYLKPKSNILRYEIGINKARRLKVITDGIYCSVLSDLASPRIWRLFGDELLRVFDSLLIADRDSIDISSLNEKEVRLLLNGFMPSYWLGKWEYNKKKIRELDKFNDFLEKHSASTMKNDIRCLIEEKIKSLIDIQDGKVSRFHRLGCLPEDGKVSRFHRLGCLPEDGKVSRFHRLGCEKTEVGKSKKCPDFTAWITGEIGTKPEKENRICSVTFLNVPDVQKRGSYLSEKGVEFYYKNNREIYEKKLEVRLSKKWSESELKIKFREIAHSIRNEKYNPANNFRRDIKNLNRNGDLLFDLTDTIREDKRVYLRAN